MGCGGGWGLAWGLGVWGWGSGLGASVFCMMKYILIVVEFRQVYYVLLLNAFMLVAVFILRSFREADFV